MYPYFNSLNIPCRIRNKITYGIILFARIETVVIGKTSSVASLFRGKGTRNNFPTGNDFLASVRFKGKQRYIE